ncbi:flagellar hook-length control protein FliK [Pseudomonadales bacterium]|nr:flagellar hook-length control protein FliK [Pseudomonadales bacterium]
MELNKENAIVSIASGTASGKKAGSEANRGVSTVSFQELVRSHSTSSDVFQGGNILPQAENFSQRPQGLPNENSTDSVKLITVGGGYVSNTFDLLIVGEQASEAEALTFAKESGLSAAAIDVIFNESKSPSAEASLSSSSDSPRLAAAVPPLIAEEGNTANLLLARAELSGARGMGLPSSSEGVSQELKGPAGERVTVTNSTGNRAELSGLGRMVSPSDSEGVSQELKGPAGERITATNSTGNRAELSGLGRMVSPSDSEGVSQELKGSAGERITATNSTGNRAELSGLGSVVLPSDSEGITKDLKAPILPRGDTTELLLRRSALTTLLGSVPEGVANSVSSEARAGLSYASNSEGYLRSQADLAKTLSSDRLSANASAEVIVSEPKEMSSVKSNALEYLRNRTELFSERLRDSEEVIPPGSVVLKSGRARTEASLSMRNTKTADSAYEALASKAKFESILPGLPPLATTKDAPGQTLLTPSLSPDNLVFSGETRLSASTPGVTGSEAAKSILNQSAVNQEGLSELRERFTARLSSDLAQRLTAGFKGGTHNLEFDLLPEKLGRIGVRMEYHEGKLEAMISSTSNVTREVLGENLPRLRELLVNSGVNVASLDIDSGSQKYSQQNSPSGDREYAAREGNTQESGVESERSQVLDFSDLNIDLWV